MSDLRQAAQQALEALQHHVEQTRPIHQTSLAITALRAALAAAVAEPVASVTECEACFTPDVCQLRGTCDHYAAERLRVAAPPQREPLTEEEIDELAMDEDGLPNSHLEFARAIERAHGIGGDA